jgi:Ca2+-binding RTX toxin-like protein
MKLLSLLTKRRLTNRPCFLTVSLTVTTTSVAQALRSYLADHATASQLAKLDAYIAANANSFNPIPEQTVTRSGNVTNFSTQGEILSADLFSNGILVGKTGTQGIIANSHTGVSPTDLHSISLLTAMLQSGDTATSTSADHTLGQVSFKLPDLLKMIFDPNLFYFSPTDPRNISNPNFLELIVNHQAGFNPRTQTKITSDAMVTRFTHDLWKLAQDGGLTMADGNLTDATKNKVSQALTAFAMQFYYEDTANAKDAIKELFTNLSKVGGSNGVQFYIGDVSTKIQAAIDAGQQIRLNEAKGFEQYFLKYINDIANFSIEEQKLIQSILPSLRDWYVQAGVNGMNVTDDKNRGAFMLGGGGSDNLTGGTGNDLLIGNAGSDELYGGAGVDTLLGNAGIDVLTGGLGNDTLLGGAGDDTYVYATGDGTDIIMDSDGQGSITYDGFTLRGGKQFGDTRVHQDKANHHLYVQADTDTLIIDGNIIIKNYIADSGALSLTMTGPEADIIPDIQTSNTINGDKQQASLDDSIIDTTANDLINAGAGSDWVSKSAGGDDIINLGDGNDVLITQYYDAGKLIANGGKGRDYLSAGAGNDVIEGGEGDDGLFGGGGNDLIYGDVRGNTQDYITQGATQQGTGLQGELVSGDDGDDKIFTGAGNDLIGGGNGDDLIVSGGGDDMIFSDNDMATHQPQGFTGGWWTTWRYDSSSSVLTNVFLGSGGSGNDVIYAGAGDDHVNAGGGNNVVFGEAGNDGLLGGSDNDILMGGAGNDVLTGWSGDDVLVGGADNDIMYGDSSANIDNTYSGNDILIGGTGNDEMHGDAGNDTYIINAGDGVDSIYDDFTTPGANTIQFGVGINPDNVKLGKGSLLLDLGNGDKVHIEGFNADDAINSVSIGRFEFADGTVLSAAQLLARGFDLNGTDANDVITGTNLVDRINGLAGNDILSGGVGNDSLDGGAGDDYLDGGAGDDILLAGEGDDTLIGGTGNDVLDGGAGADTYLFGLTSLGHDTLVDASTETSTIELTDGADLSSLTHSRVGNDLHIALKGVDASLAIQNYFSSPQNWVINSYGSLSAVADWLATPALAANVDSLRADFIDAARTQFVNRFVNDSGSYPYQRSGQDTVAYTSIGPNSIYQNIQHLSLVTYSSDAASIYRQSDEARSVTVTQSPLEAASAQKGERYTAMDSPLAQRLITAYGPPREPSQVPGESVNGYDGVLGYIPTGSGTQQTVTMHHYNNTNTTAWYIDQINGGNSGNTIYGTQKGAYGILNAITLIDGGGGNDTIYASGSIGRDSLSYGDRASDRVGGFLYGNSGDDKLYGWDFSDTLVGGDGSDDMDGGPSADTYVVFAGDKGADTIWDSGVPTMPLFGGHATAVDYSVLSTAYYAYLGIDPNAVASPPPLPKANDFAMLSNLANLGAIPMDTVKLAGGIRPDNLVFSWSQQAFNSSNIIHSYKTVSFNGIPTNSITTHAVMNVSWAVGESLNLIIPNSTDLIGSGVERFMFDNGQILSMADLLGLAGSYPNLNPQDEDNLINGYDPILYSIGYNLDGDAGNDTLNGGSGDDALAGGAGNDTYIFSAGAGNDTINNYDTTAGRVDTVQFNDIASTGLSSVRRVNNDLVLNYGANDSVTIQNHFIGIDYEINKFEFSEFGSYDVLTSSQLIALYPSNQSPVAATVITAQTATEDAAFSYTIPASSFSDADAGDTLAYSVTLADGTALPGWLTYDAATRTISGAPLNSDVGNVNLKVTAIDVAGLSANQNFALNVANTNDAPILITTIATQAATEDNAFSFVIPANSFSDVDAGDVLSYSVTLTNGAALPSWLSYDAITATLSCTPFNAHVGNLQIKLSATDLAGASATQVFDLNVANSNDAPIVTNAIDNAQVTDGSTFSWALPANVFTVIDLGDVLGFNMTLADGSALPNWLNYDAQNKTLSGTPTASAIGTLSFKVTATDTSGATANARFDLTVNAMPAKNVTGNATADILSGGSGNDVLDGGAGNDTVIGGFGDDILTGGTGSDLLLGGEGNDTFLLSADGIWASGYGVMNAGSPGHIGSNKVISITGRVASADAMDGGSGYDTLQGTAGNDIIVLDDGFTASPNGHQPRFTSIEHIKAGAGDDIIDLTSHTFSTGDITLEGNDGNDVLWASSGNDLLKGDVGNDQLDGGWGNDIQQGGAGNDTLYDK